MDTKEPYKILIVDDEPDLRELIADYIEHPDFKIFMSESGQAAYEFLKKQTVDLVICDVRMPNGNGIFLIDKIKNELKQNPRFVFVTGYSDISKKESLELGADDMIFKPLDLDKIPELIKSFKKAS